MCPDYSGRRSDCVASLGPPSVHTPARHSTQSTGWWNPKPHMNLPTFFFCTKIKLFILKLYIYVRGREKERARSCWCTAQLGIPSRGHHWNHGSRAGAGCSAGVRDMSRHCTCQFKPPCPGGQCPHRVSLSVPGPVFVGLLVEVSLEVPG